MNRFCVFSASLVVMMSSAAMAQDDTVDDGVYVRIGAGVTFASDWEQDLTYNPNQVFPAVVLPTEQRVENGEGFIATAALGFNYTEGIRTELEYRYATTQIGAVTPEDRIGIGVAPNNDVSAQFLLSNFFFDLNNDTRFTPFVGGGVGGAFVENENGDRDAALAYQGRVGISYALGVGLSADLEYVYLRTNDLSFGPNDDEFTAEGPSVRLDGDRYQSSSAMISFRKQF